MGFMQKTHKFLRSFLYGLVFGVLFMYGVFFADRFEIVDGLIEMVYAATGTIRPNGDGGTNNGTATTCGGGGNYDCLDEVVTAPTAPVTTGDYLVQTSNDQDYFQMDNSITDASTVTAITVYTYHQEGGTNMSLDVSLWNAAETTQYATTTTYTNRNSAAAWDSAPIGGLSLTQADLTGLRIRLQCTKGGGKGSDCTSYAMYAVVTYDQQIDVTVSANGTQKNRLSIPTTTAHVGGMFIMSDAGGGSRDITSITVSASGTVDAAADLDNIRLYYENAADCTAQSYNGTELQYGSTDTDGFSGANGTSTFTASGIGITPTSELCIYPVLDVTSGATFGETLDLYIADPSTDVVGSGGAIVEPVTEVAISGVTILEEPVVTQTRYHWRQDNGDQGDTGSGADSYAGGSQNTSIDSATKDGNFRLRFGVSNEGNATSTSHIFRVEFAEKVSSCSVVPENDWIHVASTTDDWDMVDSTFIADGNTTNITASGKGALTDDNTTFDGAGALVESKSTTSAITLDPDEFTELEFSMYASASIIDGTTYCFRVSDNGTALPSYTTYPEITFNADVTVSAEEGQPATISIPTNNNLLGSFVFSSTTAGTQDVDEITITASTTGDLVNDFDNIKLYWEYDSSVPTNCASESLSSPSSPTETQFGSTDTNGFTGVTGTSTFVQAASPPSVNTTRALCLYVVLDVTASSSDGETLDIKIENPSMDVVLSAGSVAPANVVSLTGVTTMTAPYLDQRHYHWRDDLGTEATASSTVGDEDLPYSELPVNVIQRLRFGVANTGGESSGNYQYQLEWAQKITTCADVASWTDVDTGGDEWSIVASQLVDNGNTTDISTTTGGVTNVGTFLSTNGAQQDVDGTTGNIDLTANGWLEIEYALQADSTAPEGATYCFRVTNNGTALDNYTIYPEATIKLGTDFAVYRGSASISGTSTVLVEGVDYSLQFGSSSRAFIRLTNTQHTGGGPAAGSSGNHNSDDVTTYIENPGNIESHVVIRRSLTPVNDTRITWEIIEYIGEIGGENEMYVHDAGVVSVGGTAIAATSSAVAGGVTNDANIVPFITAQYNADTSRLSYNQGLFTSTWSATGDTVTVTRSETGAPAEVSYAAVEFRGANWVIHRVQEDYQVNPGTTDTESFGPLQTGDITKAFIHAQHRVGNNHDDHASIGHEVWISSFSAVSFRLNGALSAGDQADHVSVAWVIENTQTSGNVMKVEQKNNSIAAGGGGLTTVNVNLSNELDDLSVSSIFVNNSNSNTQRTFPEPFISSEIISTTQFQLQVSDDTGENLYRAEVVQWPTAAAKLVQNDFWLFEDNDTTNPTTAWGGLNENEEMTSIDDPIAVGESIRIVMSYTVTAAAQPAGVDSYRLEYGERVTTCGALGVNDWQQVGDTSSTTALWRAHNGTPAAGTLLSSFELSESDIFGTYEEDNNTALNPNQALVGESVEYQWNIEDYSAPDKRDFCFRMTYADGGEFESYSTYPLIRTVGYGPEIGDWKWFDDELNVTPTTALAGTNTAPIDITFEDPIKLRAVITEKQGAAGNPAKFKLQYSEYSDFSQRVFDVASSTLCTASSTWCYYDGAGVDNATITQATLGGLSGPCSGGVGAGCGTHNESISSSTATLVQPAYSSMEFEFTIVHAGARANAVYYFRLFNVVDNEIVSASSTNPSLVTEGASLTFTVVGLNPGTTTENVTIDGSSTPTSLNFGSLNVSDTTEVAHRIVVDTNATEGYQVLMWSDQDLTNTYGSTIPEFAGDNGTPLGWAANCSNNCFGYHAGDDLLANGSNRFAAFDTYAAVSTTTAEEIMYSSVPTNEYHDIVYRIQVDNLQEAGDYEATVTYIAIPVF